MPVDTGVGRAAAAERVREVVRAPVDGALVVAVALVVAHRRHRPVHRQLREVRPAQPDQLGFQVGEVAGLEQRVVGEVDTGHDVGGVEGDLLGLGEEVLRIAVEHHPADRPDRHLLLRDELRGVEQIEVERELVLLRHQLYAELPLRVLAGLDGVPQIAPVEVRITALALLCLVPHQRVRAQPRLPVELHEGAPALRVHEPEGVHTEALHHAVTARDRPVRHQPHDRVQGLRLERHEVPQGVVRRGAGGDVVVRLRLHRVHEVRELDAVLDEEDREVVPDEVVIPLRRIELGGETPHVPHGVRGTPGPLHGREPHEDGCADRRVLEEGGPGELRAGLVRFEVAVRARAPRVHHPPPLP
ncbi:hypothetical protein M2158_007247 [Streptomyces sp. SAI-144]|nr:hypothetical protein [Streptomyces sp. SAI-144]